jgi:hypothetical protein
MAIDSLKAIFLIADVEYAVTSGGLKAPERSALAKRFGVSEEVLLRFERAKRAYDSSITPKLFDQAETEALHRMRERGKFHPREWAQNEFSNECTVAYRRLRDAMPENEITREYDEALAALKAAVEASTVTQSPDRDR